MNLKVCISLVLVLILQIARAQTGLEQLEATNSSACLGPVRFVEVKSVNAMNKEDLDSLLSIDSFQRIDSTYYDSMGWQLSQRSMGSYSNSYSYSELEYDEHGLRSIIYHEHLGVKGLAQSYDQEGRLLLKEFFELNDSNIREYYRWQVFLHDKDGRIAGMKDSFARSRKIEWKEWYYDTLGFKEYVVEKSSSFAEHPRWHKIVKISFVRDSIESVHWSWEYNAYDQRRKSGTFEKFNERKQLLSREKYYYFWGGNEGTELLDSSLIDYIYYTYNDAGLRISMKTQISQTEYSYNSRGLVAETRYSLLNSGTMIIQCKYNSSGLLIEKRVKEFDGTMSITEFMDHDQFGNWTRRMSYREDSNSRFLQRRRIQYFY